MSIKKSQESGFTLVELLVAIAIGSVFMLAVNNLIITNNHIAHRTRDLAVVNSYAENKVEALRSAGYLSLSNGTTSITEELPAELLVPRSASLVISTASTSVKKIEISVTYNDLGKPRTHSYSTYIGELGVGQ